MRVLGFEIKWVGFGTSVKAKAKKHWKSSGKIIETVKLIQSLTGWSIPASYKFFKEEVRGY